MNARIIWRQYKTFGLYKEIAYQRTYPIYVSNYPHIIDISINVATIATHVTIEVCLNRKDENLENKQILMVNS